MCTRLLDQLSRLRHPESSSGVKRALFGPVDHDENRRFVQQELDRNLKTSSDRWNFDFGSDAPLPGRYKWETVLLTPEESSIPVSEHRKWSPRSTRRPRKKDNESGSVTSEHSSPICDNISHNNQRVSQTHITDYLQHRKRSKSKVKVQECKSEDESTTTPDKNYVKREDSQKLAA